MAAFVASFSVTQAPNCSTITITDTSNYDSSEAKNTFSNRQLYLYLTDGTLLPFPNEPSFTFAAYPSDSITVPIPQDYSLNIVLVLTSTNPQTGSTYTSSKICTFLCNINTFQYGLVQQLTVQPNLINVTNFMQGLSDLQTFVDNAGQATVYSDQQSAQNAINQAYNIVNNTNYIF